MCISLTICIYLYLYFFCIYLYLCIFLFLSSFTYLRKYLPRIIENDTKEETEIRKLLSTEKIKAEIHTQDVRSEKYELQINYLDVYMITYSPQTIT